MNGRAIALRAISAAVLAACMVAPAFAVDGKASIDLEENRIGVPPLDDFDFGVTGGGQPGQWTVVRDVTAIDGVAIEQSNTDPTENRFPLAIYKPLSLKNLAASIHLKLIKGTMQTAGIAFRFVNADNYYVVSASALERRVDLFRVLSDALNHWHKLAVVSSQGGDDDDTDCGRIRRRPGQGRLCRKIHGRDVRRVVMQEGAPVLTRRAAFLRHVVLSENYIRM
jgi:hypothetical protein